MISFFKFMSYLPESYPKTGICDRCVSKRFKIKHCSRSSILDKKWVLAIVLKEFSLEDPEEELSENS